jgi:hypothetical protein
MLFASLVFISAFLIESIGSYISIVGLSALFSTNPVIIALALSLDIAKIITVSFLYKQWGNINRVMKGYMLAAAAILMVITSSGAAGYLSAEFQKAIMPTKESDVIVKTMTDEKVKLEARKIEIDKQIAQLPAESVKGRQRLAKQFDSEITRINTRLVEIDKTLPEIQLKQIDVNAHAGPILYVAEAFDTTVESAVKYVILLIIVVFDPLAVALIIAGNFLVDQSKREQNQISKTLDLLQAEVKHIEKDLAIAAGKEVEKEVFECAFPPVHQEKESLIELLPQMQEVPEKEIVAANVVEEIDIVVQEEPVLDVIVPVETPDLPQKKRGRKKKEESEPTPSITTEEQLVEVVQAEISGEDENAQSAEEQSTAFNEIVASEPVGPFEDEPSLLHMSDLNKVNHALADVSFSDPITGPDEGTWKPQQKVLNLYTKV